MVTSSQETHDTTVQPEGETRGETSSPLGISGHAGKSWHYTDPTACPAAHGGNGWEFCYLSISEIKELYSHHLPSSKTSPL